MTDGLALSEELENTYNLLQDISKALINKNVSDLRKLLNCKDTYRLSNEHYVKNL